MKIFFVVTGVGLGDATREHANIQAFLKKDQSTEILVAGYDNSYAYFKDKFPTIKIKGYRIPGKALKFKLLPFLLKNYLLPLFWFFEAFKLKAKVKAFNPDVIISDFEPTGITLAKFLKKKCVVVFGYDPAEFREYKKVHKVSQKVLLESKFFEKVYDQANLVVIPKLLGAKKKSLLYTYVNPIIRELPKTLPPEKALMKKLGLKEKPILVMLGGSDFGVKLARQISEISPNFPNEHFLIFGSKTRIATPQNNVDHKRFAHNILEYLKVCKGVITLAGQKTLTESLVFRKPLLIFPIEDHIEQLMNAYALRDVAVVSKYVDANYLKKVVEYFLEKRPEMEKKFKRLKFEANGSDQIVSLVCRILEED